MEGYVKILVPSRARFANSSSTVAPSENLPKEKRRDLRRASARVVNRGGPQRSGRLAAGKARTGTRKDEANVQHLGVKRTRNTRPSRRKSRFTSTVLAPGQVSWCCESAQRPKHVSEATVGLPSSAPTFKVFGVPRFRFDSRC